MTQLRKMKQQLLAFLEPFPRGSDVKESACNARDEGSIPWSGGSPGEGNGNLLQYSCLGNHMERGAWWATVNGETKEFIPWRRKWQPTSVFLPGESQGWGSLVGCHLQGHTESDTTEAT